MNTEQSRMGVFQEWQSIPETIIPGAGPGVRGIGTVEEAARRMDEDALL
jgi:hypothetical protein